MENEGTNKKEVVRKEGLPNAIPDPKTSSKTIFWGLGLRVLVLVILIGLVVLSSLLYYYDYY